jgi:O-antigen ligase
VLIAGLRGAARWLALTFAAASAVVLWQVAGANFQTRVAGLFSGEQDYNYTEYAGRKQIWARARGYVASNPVFGVGVGNFAIAEGNTCRERAPHGGCPWMAPHSAYWQAGAEMGIPGLALLVAMLVAGARAAFRLWRPPARAPAAWRRPELLAALLGFAVSATFLSHAYLSELFVLLGLIAIAKWTLADAAPDGRAAVVAVPRAPVRRPGRRGGLAVPA